MGISRLVFPLLHPSYLPSAGFVGFSVCWGAARRMDLQALCLLNKHCMTESGPQASLSGSSQMSMSPTEVNPCLSEPQQ